MSMHTKGKIGVKNLEFIIKKGLYPSEQIIENVFKVSAEVSYHTNEIKKDTYLNYERLVEIINMHMHSEVLLLETLAENCLKAIMMEWPFAQNALIRIEKQQPAFLNSKLDAVVVEMQIDR